MLPDMQPEVMGVLREAKRLAQQYRRATGKPFGITGEVAEYEAARILELQLTVAHQAGYDAIEEREGTKHGLQAKGSCILPNCKPGNGWDRLIEKEFDSVLLVLLDENFDATEIYEADRSAVLPALAVPGSKARNERGALPIAKFKAIGHLRQAMFF